MSKRIVIIPTFASSHFLDCWIPNIVETLEPNVIIISEGIFPSGPENKGHIESEFRKKYCWQLPTTVYFTDVGFDWATTIDIIEKYQKKYPKVDIFILPKNYKTADANQCFLEAISNFKYTDIEVGHIIFPLEPDSFVHENDKETINEEINKLSPGEGIKVLWKDFLETQFYVENINEFQPKVRRFAYCFDNMENYKAAMSGFMSQDYPRLKKVDSFFVYHYPWFVFGKFKELRYDLIYRSNPQYWKDFETGLQEIRAESEDYVNGKLEGNPANRIIIRPSRNDEGRFAKFMDIPHPEAIKNHPNFVK